VFLFSYVGMQSGAGTRPMRREGMRSDFLFLFLTVSPRQASHEQKKQREEISRKGPSGVV